VQRKIQTFQPLGFEPVPMAYGGGLEVASVSDPRTGLVRGDLILAIEDHAAGNPASAAEKLRGQDGANLWVMRNDQPKVVLYHRPPVDIDFPYLILSLFGVGYLLIGLYMLLRQAGSQGLLFYLWCLASAAFYLLTPVGPPGPLFTAIYLGDELTRIFLPALTLHMFLLFPSPLDAGRWSRRIVPFLYLPATVLLSLTLDLALANGHWIFGKPTTARLTALDHVELLHLAVFALASLALLVYRMARSRDWEQQRQLQWVAFGLGGGYLPFLLLYVGPLVLGLRMPEVLTSLAVVPLAFVPLAFAYAILRYKLWDIEVIVRDTISSTMTLLLGIIGFSLVNLAISRGVPQELAVARNLLSFVSGLAIAGLLVPTRRHFSSALERLQYRGTFGKRQALQALGRELLHQRNLNELCQALLHDIEEGVSLERVNLYLGQGGELVAAVQEPGVPGRIGLDALGEEIWRERFRRLSGVALPCEPMSVEQRLFIAGYRYLFPLTVRGRGIGLVVAGYREDQTPLNSDDIDLIRHLLDQAALAIENAQLLGQLHRQLEEVQRLQRYTEGIFESSPAGIAVLDRDGLVISANAAFVEITGRGHDELLAQPVAAVLPIDALPAPGEMAVEEPWSDPAGRERFLQVSTADFDRGQGLRILMVYDVTERVAMENELREKDRLAALGMLAAGVAHEVNTPITGISSYAQMLLSETAESDPHYAILKKVERQTFRAARIVNNLLEFARNRQKDRGPVEVPALVSECLDLLSDRVEKRRIAVEWEPPQESVRVLGCDGELQQVFANLILNALDAVSGTAGTAGTGATGGGKLTLSCEADAEKVRLRVQDNGPGIPADKLQTIFQPFYSTKLNRGGTGLGLSISHEIVRRHGGELRVESEPGQGACFTVELPRLPPARALAQA
jgi:PAS domain S-box-containing protein